MMDGALRLALTPVVKERDLLLLLGGNLGDPEHLFQRAELMLTSALGVAGMQRSRDHWTEPWGFAHSSLFLNRALWCRTTHPATAVLDVALSVERQLGRERVAGGGYAPRTIDIDILLLGDEVHDLPHLQVPHPRMHLRSFALAPAADLAPSHLHPLRGRTVLQLLCDLRGA
jgi:2-amino-4-hydroxy-6-hydroxymethyldihydropteridine diphosphokinase